MPAPTNPILKLRTVSKLAGSIADQLERLREMPVPDVARFFKKDGQWVRRTFPIIRHSPKSHAVRIADIEAYQKRRTVLP